MQSTDRGYFQRRSFDEIMAAMRADCSEAMISHVKLAELHLTRCIGSDLVPTDECVDCTLKNICDNA
ncbi:MAG: hypothetical protein V4472_26385 [Pseudomonadota bacterium]